MHGEATSKALLAVLHLGLYAYGAAQITFKDQLFSLDDDGTTLSKLHITGTCSSNPRRDQRDFNVVVKAPVPWLPEKFGRRTWINLQIAQQTLMNVHWRQALNVQRPKYSNWWRHRSYTRTSLFNRNSAGITWWNRINRHPRNNSVPIRHHKLETLALVKEIRLNRHNLPVQQSSASPFPGATTSGGVDNRGGNKIVQFAGALLNYGN